MCVQVLPKVTLQECPAKHTRTDYISAAQVTETELISVRAIISCGLNMFTAAKFIYTSQTSSKTSTDTTSLINNF